VNSVESERFGPLDFDEFHREQLPARLEICGPVFTAADAKVLRPLAFRLEDGRAYTYVPSGRTFAVEEGSDGADTVATLPEVEWHDFVWELRSAFACFYAARLSLTGNFGQLVRWEPPLRVALDGQAVYDLDDPPPVLDAVGEAIDLSASFTFADEDSAVADFLDRTGFVHLREVLDAAEVEALRAEVDAAVGRARPDDHRSWWTVVDGQEVCCRVNYLNDHSPLVAGLGDDERFGRIAALGRADLRDARDRLDGNGVVIKVPGAAEGLADLPWHRDCGMGGHPVKCPMLNVGIQLDAATPESGQLEMIAGSHRGTSRLPRPKEAAGLPVVRLDTEPGDVTVHFGHTLHAAPPPSRGAGPGRRALYLSFVPPRTFEMVGPGQGYNDVLFTRDEGRVRHVDQLT
jgi:Phytanoyl-CoA dioxygenase (PhyH)